VKVAPYVALLALTMLVFTGCGGPLPALEIGRSTDTPEVYRVSAEAESWFSGPVSDLEGGTELTAAFEVTPVSGSTVEVEVLYLAANIRDADGEPVALELGPITGKTAEVEMGPPGAISEVRGDPALLDAPLPLISIREIIASLFPPLPQEELQEDDTWTGDIPSPFANLDGPAQRMRFLLASVSSQETARIEGYELRTRPRSFESETAGGSVSGEGDLDVVFDGRLQASEGYEWTERTAEFDSRFIRISGSGYANGSLHMESTTRVERLDPTEQFGLDSGTAK
jgi:hypothetical protein